MIFIIFLFFSRNQVIEEQNPCATMRLVSGLPEYGLPTHLPASGLALDVLKIRKTVLKIVLATSCAVADPQTKTLAIFFAILFCRQVQDRV